MTLIHYAGHGLQVEGDNYLVPVDAKFEKAADVAGQAVRLSDLMATLETAPSKIRIIILDACRNNPFSALNEVAGKGRAIVDAQAGSIRPLSLPAALRFILHLSSSPCHQFCRSAPGS